MRVTFDMLQGIEALQNVPEKFLTAEQKNLLLYATELKKLLVEIENLGLKNIVTLEIKVSKRGRKKQ